MSTLDQADVMKATKTCVSAQRFQYDYLNDDIAEDGSIDYSLTDKVPAGLRKAIAEGKKILVLINPPYAESGMGIGKGNKKGVSKTKFSDVAMKQYGKACNELFTQFVVRITKEIPSSTLAMFSTLKYINAPTLATFRQTWNAKYLGGFAVHSKAFDGLKGNFPIGFLIWVIKQNSNKKTSITEVKVEVLNKNTQAVGEKIFHNVLNSNLLTNWIKRSKANKIDTAAIPTLNRHK